jgi:CRP/FNR family transcriptional regulator, cyclic AMP receptor protein
MQTVSNAASSYVPQTHPAGELFSKLSPDAMEDLASIEFPTSYPPNITLFSEDDPPPGVFVVLEGEVKLSINSSDGRRLTLRIVRKGEILGLVSAFSGNRCEMTAETLYPCRIAPISRREFLAFLARHPEAYKAVTEELSRQIGIACSQLRTVGLSSSAPEKLARLLLEWSQNGQTTESGTKFRFSLTHEEIGEFIGASRETVTRTLNAFKNHRLVNLHGSTLTIPSRTALESYAGC